jgi:hypothetical protein
MSSQNEKVESSAKHHTKSLDMTSKSNKSLKLEPNEINEVKQKLKN